MAWSISTVNSTDVIGPTPLLARSILVEGNSFTAGAACWVVGAFLS